MKIDKLELSGLIVLFIGVFLLAFTFVSAYTFLVGQGGIPGSQNILDLFGKSMAPLIEALIRILYLGIMGWIGSISTMRAVQLLRKERRAAPTIPQPQSSKRDTQQETKSPETGHMKKERGPEQELQPIDDPKEAEAENIEIPQGS